MDAFVVRKRPATRLFEEDRVLLVPPTQSRDEEVRQWILSHGGQVVTEASDATRIVVLTATDTLTADDKAHVAAARQRQPRASVLQWEWVRDCVEKNARLPEQSYRCNDLMSRNGDSGDDQGDRKKRRIESHEERGALSGSDDLGSEADVPILPPQLRPWRDIDNGSLYYMDARNDSANGDSNPLKIAAFDLDGTIIVTKSGKRFAENANDWKFFHPSNVKQKLKQLAKQGFLLVILSNQNGVAKGKTSATDVQKKMEAIVTNLGVQMVVLFATKDDLMRKPRYGAWQWLLNELNVDESMPVDKTKSFYCGDAAGRPKIAGRNKDFAATDYKLALNLQLPFFTPEALFLNATQRIHTRPEMWEIDFDPRPLVQSSPAGQNLEPADAVCVRSEQELIVLVGPPASGKSFNARRLFSDASASYVVVNQDELKSVARCKSACIDALKSGKSVVVDSTNRDPRARREWVDVAKAQKLPVRCFVLDISKPLAMHLNTFRMLTSAKAIPEIAIHTYFKNATPPKKDEGFDEIVHVRFSADLAALSDEHQRLLGSFL
ncbi:hypothetical protein Poli38472_000469 [Pythium oligandrum]|uniref:BRCT domain-containing protein n=1 Tax=Pythium oligandrum TaxID=41045 RepID=A0A8K1CC01_PYTOL|nr:hypothetical protein Poli38472_000469 [Pythium oligandrum]|eukprot:TMW60427.1 hypothetical protein Poli38472_000469 [Pythium oligandrum]